MSLVGFTLLGSIEAPTLTGTATGVPLLVKPNTEFTAAMLLNLDVGGGDLRFSSDAAGLNQLPCEIDDGLDVVWVKPTGVSISTGATLYVWGDNTGASQPAVGDAFGRDAVWVDEVSRYHLSTGTGNAIDSKGVENGVLVGGTTTQAAAVAAFGNSTFFNDAPYYTRSDPFAGVSTFGAAIWHNLRVTTPTHGLLASWESSTGNADMSVLWWATGAGKINLRAKNTMGTVATAIGATVLAVGQDYHLAIRYDGATLKTYIDGVQDASIAFTGTIDTSTIPFNIMSYDTLGTNPFDGYSQELAIGDRTPSQISIEYDNQSATGPWWIAADTGGAITVPATLGTISYTGQSTTVSITGSIDVAATLGTIAYTSNNATVDISGSVDAIVTLGAIDYTSNNTTVGITGSVDVITTLGTIDYSSSNVTVDVTGSVDALATLGAITYTSVSPIVSIGGAIVVSSTLGTITYSSNDTVISLQGVVSVPATLGTISYSSNDAVVSLAGLIDVNATLGTISYTSDNTTVTVAAGQSFGVVGVGFADDIYGSTFKPDSTTVNFRG